MSNQGPPSTTQAYINTLLTNNQDTTNPTSIVSNILLTRQRSVHQERLKPAKGTRQARENIAEWIVAYWWAVLLMGIALIMLMAGFIKICSVHTPSSNPKLPPHKPLPGTLKRRRPPQTTQPPQRQRPRESYQMGHMRR